MFIKIDFQSEIPIYTQLYNEIIKGIAKGELLPGEALPSVRVFSQDLGINMHTVNKTYGLLKQDNFIQVHRQKGVEINPDGFPPADEVFLEKLRENLEPLVAESIARGMSHEEIIKECSKVFEKIGRKGE
ncbi:MAG: GntR family transcriptional regulator [Eubacteriales bacterium]|mgnify:CR=1 FL=1|nr:GntR family transcriptional regulator [Eubacteriales bacterium]